MIHRPIDRRRAVVGTVVTTVAFVLALLQSGALSARPPGGTVSVTLTVRLGGPGETCW